MNVRAAAAKVLYQVVDRQQSLSAILPEYQQKVAEKDRALLQEICYGVLRWLPRLEAISRELIQKPLTGKLRPVHHLILVGIYQLHAMRIPAHAAVAETVSAINALKKPALKGMINGVLRNFQRNQAELEAKTNSSVAAIYGHPGWLVKRLKAHYPAQWQTILNANNERPPMWIRVNQQRVNAINYQQQLQEIGIVASRHPIIGEGLLLDAPCDVSRLPGFNDGHSSVQDGAAQLCAELLGAQPGEKILDCCAAPGGKTMHLLERCPTLRLQALDIEPERLKRVEQNAQRLGFTPDILCADAAKPELWWDGELYDRILLDAPCSATGVIRRHPDIKWLRKAEDIDALVIIQNAILEKLWPLLKTGGTLLYATCSVLPEENERQIDAFIQRHQDAQLEIIPQAESYSNPAKTGWQLLPGDWQQDGFYYCKLTKKP